MGSVSKQFTAASVVLAAEFDSDLGTLVFHRNANGRVTGLGVFTVNAGNVSFDKAD